MITSLISSFQILTHHLQKAVKCFSSLSQKRTTRSSSLDNLGSFLELHKIVRFKLLHTKITLVIVMTKRFTQRIHTPAGWLKGRYCHKLGTWLWSCQFPSQEFLPNPETCSVHDTCCYSMKCVCVCLPFFCEVVKDQNQQISLPLLHSHLLLSQKR